MASTAAVQIVEEVIDEMTRRKGLRHVWEGIDAETQIEIVGVLQERADAVLKKLLGL